MANQTPQGTWYGGTPAHTEQFGRFTPEQEQALNKILEYFMQNFQKPEQGFQPIEEEALRQYREQGVPDLAERFTSLGSGAQSSSGFREALASGEQGLRSQLGALKAQYGLQRSGALTNLLQAGLAPRFETGYFQRQPGFFENLAVPAATGLGYAFGGPIGGKAAGGLASLLGGHFSGGNQQQPPQPIA